MKTREYDISFKRAGDPEAGVEVYRVRAPDPDGARRKLEARPDLAFIELTIIEVKAVPGSAEEDGPEAAAGGDRPRNRIADRLSAAPEFTDGDDYAGDDMPTDEPPEDIEAEQAAPSKLSRAEWKILRECVNLDENDADNGKRLLKWFGGQMLNVQEAGWHLWTGTHWDAEQGGHAIERFAHLVVQRIKREAALIEFSREEAELMRMAEELVKAHPEGKGLEVADRRTIDAAKELAKALSKKRSGRYNWGVRAGDRSRTRAMIDQAEPHCTVSPNQLDQDDFAINCINGTVRIRRAENPESDPDEPTYFYEPELDPHNPDDLFTKRAEVEYLAGAECPLFMEDLRYFQPDKGMREFLQVFMGYVMLGVTGEQVYAFFYGDGANFKSSFLQAIARTMGTYAKPMSYTSVSGNNMPTGDKPSPDWARLSGVRMLTIEEVPRKDPIKEELVKLFTSGTLMPVRHLNKGLFDLVPKFTVSMTSNAEPNIGGHDKGIWRRTLIVPWDVMIAEDKRLPFDVVMARFDKERAGIFNWLIEGACKYREHGLQPYVTKRMRDFTDSVRADRDAAGSFIEDCVVHQADNHVTAGDLYRAFVAYCHANGIDPILNSTAFGRQVKRVDVNGVNMEKRKHKVQGVRRFNDIALHDVPEEKAGEKFGEQLRREMKDDGKA